MKLCHIVPSLAEEHGGPSKSVQALCVALARAGDQVDLLATDPAAPREGRVAPTAPAGLRTEVFRRDWPEFLCPSGGLRDALVARDIALVHHHSIWLRTLHYAHRRAQRGIPLVISPRGMMSQWAWQHRRARKRLARAFVHPRALEECAGWHATSEAEQDEIRALGFAQPVCVAPNGIEAPSPETVEAARRYWRQECPAISQHRVALFYSRFHRKKRVLELIELWRRTAPAGWLLLLVGIPQDYTPEELMARGANSTGDRPVAVFSGLGRPKPYAVASLFLLPSHNENFGLVVGEAMAHGVPVVVTDTTPWRAIHAQRLGWCVPWESFGAAISEATGASEAELAHRGAAARDWVLREYSWDRSATTLHRFYEALLRDRTP